MKTQMMKKYIQGVDAVSKGRTREADIATAVEAFQVVGEANSVTEDHSIVDATEAILAREVTDEEALMTITPMHFTTRM